MKQKSCREIPARKNSGTRVVARRYWSQKFVCVCFFIGVGQFCDAIEIADAKRPGPSENLSGTDP